MQKRGTLKKNQAGFSRKSSAEESQKYAASTKRLHKAKKLKLVIIYYENITQRNKTPLRHADF